VNDVKNYGLQSTSPGQVYFPSGQSDLTSARLIARTDAPLETIGPMLRRTIASIDRELPLALLQTLEQTVDSSIAQPKFSMIMLTIFASIALALAAVGIYGVISYSVAQRTREIGVRIALGAQRSDVLRMIVGQGMVLSVIGVLVGGGAAAASGRVIAKHLFGVVPSDPAVFAGVAAVLLAIAFLASAVPAMRATKIDPVEAMRRD
jgi:putative ABC transport system permease protein